MKKIVWLFVLLLAAFTVQAQNAAFGELYGSYAGRPDFTSVELGRKMMQMMSSRMQESDRKLAELLSDIRSIRMIASGKSDPEFVAQMQVVAEREPFHLLSSISEQGQTTRFYFIDGGASRESEFLMITFGPKETVAVNIVGYFDVKEVSRLAALRPK